MRPAVIVAGINKTRRSANVPLANVRQVYNLLNKDDRDHLAGKTDSEAVLNELESRHIAFDYEVDEQRKLIIIYSCTSWQSFISSLPRGDIG